jgi:hypothetical protein
VGQVTGVLTDPEWLCQKPHIDTSPLLQHRSFLLCQAVKLSKLKPSVPNEAMRVIIHSAASWQRR